VRLPQPLDRIVPELGGWLPDNEPLSDCAACVMAAPAAPQRPVFAAPARCCTYHPHLANFLVGQALERGGSGAEQIRARLRQPSGLDPSGIHPSAAHRAQQAARPDGFGNDQALACPYWVEGPQGCSIHAHRDAVCRTWFCRVGRGGTAHAAWMAARDLIRSLERAVAEAVEALPGDDWEAYFLGCWHRAQQLDPATLRGPRTQALVDRVQRAAAARDRPLPRCPTPRIARWTTRPAHVELEAWSPNDPFLAPPWIFQLLARLDGATPWSVAQRAVADELGVVVPPDLCWQLWQRGLLAAPEEGSLSEGPIEILPPA